jgi:hypothetical protein
MQYGNAMYTAPTGATYAEIAFTAATGAVPNSTSQIYLDDVSLSTGSGSSSGGASAWNISGSGDWNVATNWTNGVPNGVDAEADLFNSITATHTVYTDIPITLGTLNFNNTNTYVVTGAGSLTMQASTGSATVIVQQGTQKINLPLTIASNTTLNVSSGATLLISNPITINAGDSLTATGAGTVTYQSTLTLGAGASIAIASDSSIAALTLGANATASIASSSRRLLLQTNSLSLATGSAVDLANDDIIIHGGNLADVTSEVQSGYSGGTWKGTGITSSAAATDSTHLTAVGVVQATAAGTFDGATVAAGDVLVRYTYYGDATLDGKVDGSDYSRIDNGALLHLTGWGNGDFNYDGVVNGSDYTLIDNVYNTQGAQIASASGEVAASTAQIAGSGAVPEPGTLSILSLAAVGALRRRRSGNSR